MFIQLRLLFLVSFIIIMHFPAFTGPARAVENEYFAENIQNFIRHLISRDEYYRAYVELKRLNSYYPGYLPEDKSYISELYLLFNGGRYDELLKLDHKKNDPNISALQAVFNADVCFNKSQFLDAGKVLESAGLHTYNKNVEFYLYKRTILSFLLLRKIDEAKAIFKNGNIDYGEFGFTNQEFNELTGYTESSFSSKKNQYTALMLGIIPGLGYAYSGQFETGIIAFILISAMSAATYFAFRTDNKPIGVFFGLATSFFYGGSIIGGYMGTRSYNKSVEEGLLNSMSQKMDLSGDRERIMREFGVMSVGK